MGKFKQKLTNFAAKIFFSLTGNPLSQKESLAQEGKSAATKGMDSLLRRTASEGAVLLKNEGVLPLKGKTALFGRVQCDTFYTGYGSGGDVIKPYRVSILEGCKACGDVDETLSACYESWVNEHPVHHGSWGNWPRFYPEMPLDERTVEEAANRCESAVVVIGRASGEDRENELKRGSYYLTREEEKMLALVTMHFKKVAVVLNVGSIMDFSWEESYPVGAILLVWQGGMEAGNAVADLLFGKVSPCGKLPDTIAKSYEDYPSAKNFGNADYNEYREDIFVGYRGLQTFAPERVRYPFGYGLSYTRFSTKVIDYGETYARVRVRNEGEFCGREVVQIYLQKPSGALGTPVRELIAFAKTKTLAPCEEEEVTLTFTARELSSYDEEHACYVKQAGEYLFFVGENVRDCTLYLRVVQAEKEIVRALTTLCAPRKPFSVLAAVGEERKCGERTVGVSKGNLRALMLESIPSPIPKTQEEVTFYDVREGKISLETFVGTLSFRELEALSRGDYVMNSPLGAKGNAGVFGGVLPSLRKKGVPPVTCVDGPCGIRLKRASSLLPIATLLASTFDETLVEEVYRALGEEMLVRDADVLLAPAMNLHRNPLCGRNFEYFAEDPLLAGKIAAAVVRGVQSRGVSACPKHFCCNNQEFNRSVNDSRVSERALREIYLRSFEICVSESKPQNIMTAYNKINGTLACYHFELCREILRGEWGFEGSIMTDWGMNKKKCKIFPALKYHAYRVRAGVNVFMPGGSFCCMLGAHKPEKSISRSLKRKNGLRYGELQRNAVEILRFVLQSSANQRFKG